MKRVSQGKLLDTLYKKAMGYNVEEVVEEFSGDERGGELIKKKITTKAIPPDMAALKMYLELAGDNNEMGNLSDADLIKERDRILSEIKMEKIEKKVGGEIE